MNIPEVGAYKSSLDKLIGAFWIPWRRHSPISLTGGKLLLQGFSCVPQRAHPYFGLMYNDASGKSPAQFML